MDNLRSIDLFLEDVLIGRDYPDLSKVPKDFPRKVVIGWAISCVILVVITITIGWELALLMAGINALQVFYHWRFWLKVKAQATNSDSD
jgi:hypothetical protein